MRVSPPNSNELTRNFSLLNVLCDMNTQPCVFIVDDDDAVRDSLFMVIEAIGLACMPFDCAEQFLEQYSLDQTGCLVLDYSLPGLNGLELQAELNRCNIRLPIIFLTAQVNKAIAICALEAGAFAFQSKPVKIELLIDNIKAALQHGNNS
jgi:FixJ family two-component response regulator